MPAAYQLITSSGAVTVAGAPPSLHPLATPRWRYENIRLHRAERGASIYSGP